MSGLKYSIPTKRSPFIVSSTSYLSAWIFLAISSAFSASMIRTSRLTPFWILILA